MSLPDDSDGAGRKRWLFRTLRQLLEGQRMIVEHAAYVLRMKEADLAAAQTRYEREIAQMESLERRIDEIEGETHT